MDIKNQRRDQSVDSEKLPRLRRTPAKDRPSDAAKMDAWENQWLFEIGWPVLAVVAVGIALLIARLIS